MKYIPILFLSFCSYHLIAQNNQQVTPAPAFTQNQTGVFHFDKKTGIVSAGKNYDKEALLFNDLLQQFYGYRLPISKNASKFSSNSNKIILQFNATIKDEGAYELQVADHSILISSGNSTGIFYGLQTLLQLLPPEKMDACDIAGILIKDKPRFAYRGMHLDVARHFSSAAFVKKYIDYLAMHKYNNFHWHLTDDQGWRIEIKKYPLLTSVGGCRAETLVGRYGSDLYDNTPYCGFYTQQQIKEIVAYATARHINVIPEIEMPGHAMAALASYPYLGCTKGPYKTFETWGVIEDVFCAGNDSTFHFLEDVLTEVMALFPSKYIHIGGDECPKERWKHCVQCQKRIKDNHLKDEFALQSYFIQRIEKFINKNGRSIIGWDEILEGGLAPNATVMSWRGEQGGIEAAKQKHNVIMTPGEWCYFDHSQSLNEDSITIGGYVPLEKVYGYEPIPASLKPDEIHYILGAQANLWTEYITNPKKIEYMIFPRMTALSEVLWSPKASRNWDSFEDRIPQLMKRYKLWGANYSNAFYDLQAKVVPLPHYKIGWYLSTKSKNDKIIIANSESLTSAYEYTEPVEIKTSGLWQAALQDENKKIVSNWVKQQFLLNKASGKPVTLTYPPAGKYAGSGGFSLVDGVVNTMGMSKSSQFLGFNGSDMEAIVDLGEKTVFQSINLHAFAQPASWIYPATQVTFYSSDDGVSFTELATVSLPDAKRNHIFQYQKPGIAQFIKIKADALKVIPSGLPGAGYKPWIFFDEIEIN
ncbi:MAG: family 20 glycosylhydrolase [Niastella sp.]|nr:family 20 glycosylhydrolase [Niastella sp.]